MALLLLTILETLGLSARFACIVNSAMHEEKILREKPFFSLLEKGENAREKRVFTLLDKENDGSDNHDNCFNQQEKKRGLTPEQVQFLWKSFEVEIKLEPKRSPTC
ncbi:hypothetical protein ACH5RR_039469 [Cinchona calisaya]|uniref:Uncharacterized protein n=1 Tax=Cinchona calisaya TaxID=153742 RepID=A0ABD2XYC0_9GENT